MENKGTKMMKDVWKKRGVVMFFSCDEPWRVEKVNK